MCRAVPANTLTPVNYEVAYKSPMALIKLTGKKILNFYVLSINIYFSMRSFAFENLKAHIYCPAWLENMVTKGKFLMEAFSEPHFLLALVSPLFLNQLIRWETSSGQMVSQMKAKVSKRQRNDWITQLQEDRLYSRCFPILCPWRDTNSIS